MIASSNPDSLTLMSVHTYYPCHSDAENGHAYYDMLDSNVDTERKYKAAAAGPNRGKASEEKYAIVMNGKSESYILSFRRLVIRPCCVSCVFGIIVFNMILLSSLFFVGHPKSVQNGKVRVPCDEITYYYPVAGWHMYNDTNTNKMFKAEGIARVKNEADDTVLCEVQAHQLMGKMTRAEFDVVDAKVTLAAETMGKPLTYSSYPLSIKKLSFLRQVGSEPTSLIVQKTGNYFVYLGIELDYTQEDFCSKQPYISNRNLKTFIAHVYIQELARTHPSTILWIMHTCDTKKNNEKDTTFTGGLFHLVPGDKISVKVSAPEIVSKSDSNILGLVKLQEKEKE